MSFSITILHTLLITGSIFLSLAGLGHSMNDMTADECNTQQDRYQDGYCEEYLRYQRIVDSLSSKEKKWYRKFQEGLMLFDGWEDIHQEILESLPGEEHETTSKKLDLLGMKIGTEWAKENDIRKIDTAMLKTWGKRLRKAKDEGAEVISTTLEDISQEVDIILAEYSEK